MSEARVPDLCLRSNRHRGCSDAGSGPVVAASGSSFCVTDERAHSESWQYPQSRREDLVLGQGSLTSAGRTKVRSRYRRQPDSGPAQISPGQQRPRTGNHRRTTAIRADGYQCRCTSTVVAIKAAFPPRRRDWFSSASSRLPVCCCLPNIALTSWVYSSMCRSSFARSCTSSCIDTVVMEVMGKTTPKGERHEL